MPRPAGLGVRPLQDEAAQGLASGLASHCVPAAGALPHGRLWSPGPTLGRRGGLTVPGSGLGDSGLLSEGRSMRQGVGGLTGPRLSLGGEGRRKRKANTPHGVQWRQSCTGQQAGSEPCPSQGRLPGGPRQGSHSAGPGGSRPGAAGSTDVLPSLCPGLSVRPEPLR